MSETEMVAMDPSIAAAKTRRLPHPAGPMSDALVRALVVAGLTALAFLLRAGSFGLSVLNWDESLYLVMAQQWLQHHLPYVAVWDQHPVGLPALFAAFGAITPDLLLSARVAATLAVAWTACLLYLWGDWLFRSRPIGVLAGLLYVLHMADLDSLPANDEVFNNLLIAGGATLLLYGLLSRRPSLSRPSWRLGAGAGLIFGCALQVKYTVFPEVALLSCGYLATHWYHGHRVRALAPSFVVLILTGLAPTLLAIGYFASHGALGAWYAANVTANAAYATLLPTLHEAVYHTAHSFRFLVLDVAAAGTAILMLRTRRIAADGSPIFLILIWLTGAAIDVVSPMKFYWHYFIVLTPPLSLLAAWAVIRVPLPARLHHPGWLRALFIMLLLAVPFGRAIATNLLVSASDDAPRLVAAAVRAQHPTDANLYVFDYQPVVYYLTDLQPPSRFVMPNELSVFSKSSGSGGATELARILANHPQLIVTCQPGVPWMPDNFKQMVQATLVDYDLIDRIPDKAEGVEVLLYKRKQK